MNEWRIYRGVNEPHDGISLLPDPPPWRAFDCGGEPLSFNRDDTDGRWLPHFDAYQTNDHIIEAVNTALYLRRPLLITGDPGGGKSTLAYAVARELRLGPVLRWPVNSKTALKDGLYHYDSLGRLEEASLARDEGRTARTDVSHFVRLGPLGTALAPYELPRVLLIDEIDKSDIDLPNDLLDVFEEGMFEIPELSRIANRANEKSSQVKVRPSDAGAPVTITNGLVRCHSFPFVVLTSNGEREFPPAFLRRCVRLHLPTTRDDQRLREIVRAHLSTVADEADEVIERFLEHAHTGDLATDQLLNAVYLLQRTQGEEAPNLDRITDMVFQHLNTGTSK